MSRLIALLVALVCLPSVCFAEGALRATDAHGSPLGNLPLIHTDVRMDVADGITGVTVTQRFRNGFSQPIEAVYVFPLPVDAAIDAMSMRIGEREIRAAIARREEARETYDAAVITTIAASVLLFPLPVTPTTRINPSVVSSISCP